MSSTLPISKIAWLDSWLNTIFSFTRSSRIQILFQPILIHSLAFCIRICEFLFHSFVLQECICADFFVTEMSVHIHVRSGMRQIHFWGAVRDVLYSSLVFLFFVPCFQRPGTSVSEVGCCCWLCQVFFYVTLGAGLGGSSLPKSTRSPFWAVTRSMQSPDTVA